MPRRKKNETNHDLLYGQWQIFGEWMTQQRMIVRLTQQQAADAVRVSRRQWIRYELGAKVPVRRMKAIAKLFHVSEENVLDRAGYRVSYKRNLSNERLERVLDMLNAGNLDFAIIRLLRLNDQITGTTASYGPRFGGLVATDYANAVMLLNRLPSSWVKSLQTIMRERIHDKEDRIEFLVRGSKLIRRKRIELQIA